MMYLLPKEEKQTKNVLSNFRPPKEESIVLLADYIFLRHGGIPRGLSWKTEVSFDRFFGLLHYTAWQEYDRIITVRNQSFLASTNFLFWFSSSTNSTWSWFDLNWRSARTAFAIKSSCRKKNNGGTVPSSSCKNHQSLPSTYYWVHLRYGFQFVAARRDVGYVESSSVQSDDKNGQHLLSEGGWDFPPISKISAH